MSRLDFPTLGETWWHLVAEVLRAGTPMGEEGFELLGVTVAFSGAAGLDPIGDQFGDRHMLGEMKKVFFAEGSNDLGHSYAHLMQGPGGRHDLSDVVALLRAEPWTKRAVVSLCGPANGKVPCLNTIQFLVRAGAVQTLYFARGQDAFRKFYADGSCLKLMSQQVAAGLGLPAGKITGFIGSSHLYHSDLPAIRQLLSRKPDLATDVR